MQFLYARVSTSDQTATHQVQQARAAGFDIDEDNAIKDEGVSGISTRFAERDGGRRLLDKLQAGDVLVVRWLDRLGRNYDNVRDTVQAPGRYGNMMMNPSQASEVSHSSISPAIVAGLSTTARPP
jgi:DNA invertase Pin-like site-specific DNA recombinase